MKKFLHPKPVAAPKLHYIERSQLPAFQSDHCQLIPGFEKTSPPICTPSPRSRSVGMLVPNAVDRDSSQYKWNLLCAYRVWYSTMFWNRVLCFVFPNYFLHPRQCVIKVDWIKALLSGEVWVDLHNMQMCAQKQGRDPCTAVHCRNTYMYTITCDVQQLFYIGWWHVYIEVHWVSKSSWLQQCRNTKGCTPDTTHWTEGCSRWGGNKVKD